jgi:hypothetical protein
MDHQVTGALIVVKRDKVSPPCGNGCIEQKAVVTKEEALHGLFVEQIWLVARS